MGDEMNIHMAQSVQARNELKRLANVKYQIIGAKDSNPIIGCVQDALSGCYLLTKLDTKIIGREVANFLCSTTSDYKYEIDKDKYYTGHEIFSYIIPKGINNIVIKNGKKEIEIIDGQLKIGTLNKKTLSIVKNSIIHYIWDKFGPDLTRRFIDDVQRLALAYLNYHGFTVGIKDCIIDKKLDEQLQLLIDQKILEYEVSLTQYENDTEQFDPEIIEYKLYQSLNSLGPDIGNIILKNLDVNNNFFVCIDSGSKGSIMNITGIMGCIGQKSIEEKRIKKKIENRSLSIFHKDDDSPKALGFIRNSYTKGLTDYEYFWDTIAGREGLIATAIKSVTWETPIIIIENNVPIYTEIGKWIDNLLYINKSSIEHHIERQLELLNITDCYIPTTDYSGNVTWGNITAVTRHDPGEQLYEIITKSGRKVTVTESKSLLIWNNNINEFREMLTPEIKEGDCVPVTETLSKPPIINEYYKIDDDHNIKLDKKHGILLGLYLTYNLELSDNYNIELTDANYYYYDYLYDYLYYELKFRYNKSLKCWILNNKNLTLYLAHIDTYDIPNEILNAPNDFIIGFLSIYINEYVIFDDNYILIDVNKTNQNKIILLLSYLGIHCIINNEFLIICNEYIKLFFDIFAKTFTCKKRIELLKSNYTYNISNNKINNVILDEIVQINLIDVKYHKKVYDLTIPNTFNFGLANGLQVRDTASTGYIQRQLIKSLEDLSIKYDLTNRNAKNMIVQYVYGDSGIEQSSQTELHIRLISMNNKELEDNFAFTKEEISKLKGNNLDKFNKKYIEQIKNYRDKLRTLQAIFNNDYKTLKEKYMLPVNLFRLTQDYSKHKVNLELDPNEILDDINELLDSPDLQLLCGLNKNKHKNLIADDKCYKYLFEISLHDYLSPKKCIFEYGLSKTDFKNLIKDIKLNFVKAIIQPGEMVGIIAAQSIGEPSSQMSLMGNQQNKIIKIKNNKITFLTKKIGEFCDKLIKKYPELTFDTGHVNSVETNLESLDTQYYIIGVDHEELTHWNKISHISRHPVNGQVMKVTTNSGRTTHTTLSHSHLIRKDQTIVPIVGSQLTKGMRIPVAKHIDNTFINEYIKIDDIDYKLDYLFGWFIGAYLAEGSINSNRITITNISEHFINNTKLFAERFDKECTIREKIGEYGPAIDTSFNCKPLAKFLLDTCGTGSFVKKVGDFVFTAPNEFKAGLICAYIDGDGNFQADESRHQIRVCSRSEQLIKDIGLLLSYFDMFGSIKCNYTRGSNIYNLSMSAKYSILYKKHIGSLLHKEKLDKIVEYATRENAHDVSDEIDKINGLGEIIAKCGKELNLPGQSRNYGRWRKKESIGRRTLEKYIKIFESHVDSNKIVNELKILKQAVNSNVIWDEIKEIEIYDIDENEYVYDFTVPGNQTFMTDSGIIVHNTLNVKHAAGSKSKTKTTMGVPRIQELLHYSKNIKTPEMTIYLNDDICLDKSKVNKISSYLTHLNIKDLISSAEIVYDMGSTILINDKVSIPFFVNNQKAELSSLPFVFRLKMNMIKMHDKEITLLDIKIKFINYWIKNFSNLKNMKKLEKDIFTKISRCAILSNNIIDNQIIHIRFNMSSFNLNLLTEFLKIVLNQIILKGIEHIESSTMIQYKKLKFNKENGDQEISNQYIINTEGINFEKLKYIKGINHTISSCNDISTIYRLYGIEAAKQTIIDELNNTFSSDGATIINHAHMSVLIDMMTFTGGIISIDRHGLGKIDSDPIAKASFEKTMEHFLNAAIFNETDHIESVSSRIMLGRVIPGGTGCFDLMLDTNKLENSEYTKNENGGRITFTGLEEESLFKDILKYGFTKMDFFLPIN
jgi:DNA-directed RNA polymerase beta' subunit